MMVLRWFVSQWLVSLTLLLYLWVGWVKPEKALMALQSGATLLGSVCLLVLAVMGLVGLVQVWISRDTVARLLGQDSGPKALLIAALCGTLLIGPPYIIFPLLMTIRKQGARWAVVTIVLAAYAVKLPMIPLEVGFLGWPFSLGRSLLTLFFAIPTGLIVEKMMEQSGR
ncbi:MAG: hypothetical protein C0615_05225 [Desulfuromonas sp.]|nr:MAG: hypothetical protein C0615_05225 [Desulfuromonas sp.]